MKEPREIGYHTDNAMKMIWLSLCDDLCISGFQPIRAALARGDIRAFRQSIAAYRLSYSQDCDSFKRAVQLLNFTKRYRFANDLFSDADLELMSWKNYSDTQLRCAKPIPVDKLYRCGLVSRWRRIASAVLGDYTETEHFERCSFAKNACVGHPSSRKGLDQKLKGPFTGSTEHNDFLRRYAETDPTLKDIIDDSRSPFRPVPSLRLSFVPKSFKALRCIMPDTLTGSFYSSGLGEMIQSRLTKAGLNINTLQRRHRRLAMKASRVYGWRGYETSSKHRLATVDLSSASDSITTQLLSMILPRKWFHAVTRGRVAYFNYGGQTHRLVSACTMGLGHTFPLETLVFYVLTKGIAEWYGQKAADMVSVYGDDIIVPTEVLLGSALYPSLISIFRTLHLNINPDKSFWGWCHFRESCGGDFYRGHDVRPASPQAQGCMLTASSYVMFLYKVANSLLARWHPCEIETALAWITLEIWTIDGAVLAIPPSFPDHSGLKVDPGTFFTTPPESVNFGSAVVEYYRLDLPYRRVFYEKASYWDRMRVGARMPPPSSNPLDGVETSPCFLVRRRKVRCGSRYRTVTYLAVPDGGRTGHPKLTRTICPSWA